MLLCGCHAKTLLADVSVCAEGGVDLQWYKRPGFGRDGRCLIGPQDTAGVFSWYARLEKSRSTTFYP